MFEENPYFNQILNGKDKDRFLESQYKFFHAVNFFSRPLFRLASNCKEHRKRILILHNIIEEHGGHEFDSKMYHSNTFLELLARLGSHRENINDYECESVRQFNTVLYDVCDNLDKGSLYLGMIELMFAHISEYTAKVITNNRWVKTEDMIHYNLHAMIDIDHATDLFAVCQIEDNTVIYEYLVEGFNLFDQLYRSI